MKAKNRFEETKIKLIMKLRGMTREDAIREMHLENDSDGTDGAETNPITGYEEHIMTAKEFFGEIDDDDDGVTMPAGEFFKS